METKQKTSEEELEEILDDGDIGFFLEIMYEEYREQIVRLINRSSLGLLDASGLQDVFSITMVEVWKVLQREGADFHKPLRIVNRIANFRARDALRKRLRLRKIADNEAALSDLLIDDLKGTQLAYEWRLAGTEEQERFQKELPDILQALSDKQRVAFLAYRDCIEEIRANNKYQVVVEQIFSATGERLSVAAVRSRLNQAFEKIRDEAQRRSFDFMEDREL